MLSEGSLDLVAIFILFGDLLVAMVCYELIMFAEHLNLDLNRNRQVFGN